MSASSLRFSLSKTEIMWLGAGNLLQQVDVSTSLCFHRQSHAVGVWPWCHTRQPAVILCSHCCAVSVWLSCDRCCHDCCSGVYCLSFGLVQLASVWCAIEGAVSTECCYLSTDQRTQMWPHHSTAGSVTLAASTESSRVQDCVSCTPVASFTCTDLPDYW